MSPRRKPASPEKVAALAAERRLAEKLADGKPEAWGVNVEAMTMPANASVQTYPSERGERAKPARRLGGLEWLNNKGRLTGQQYSAGVRYGDDWRSAYDVRVRSCLNDDVSGGDPTTVQEARTAAQARVAAADSKGLAGHQEMKVLCKLILVEGMTIRAVSAANDAETIRKETVMIIALELLAKHYGMICS